MYLSWKNKRLLLLLLLLNLNPDRVCMLLFDDFYELYFIQCS